MSHNWSVSAFALVHSPLVGPTTWRWVARELEAAGHHVSVPTAEAARGWAAFADAMAANMVGGEVVVGHSGAGPLLPQIADRAPGQLSALVFVDAAVPPKAGAAELMPDWLLADLRPLATDGVLPPWSDWFGSGVMRELVPDAEKRSAVCLELPRLPLAYFEDRVPVPTGWTERPSGYVLLSEPYATDADEAESRGWPVVRRMGAHLDIVTHPTAIADAITFVTTSLQGG